MKFREWDLQVVTVEIAYNSEEGTYNTRTVLTNFETDVTVTIEHREAKEALIFTADSHYTLLVEDAGKIKRSKRGDVA